MNLFDSLERDEFIERLQDVFPTVPFEFSDYDNTCSSGCGYGFSWDSFKSECLSDKALFCKVSQSAKGNPCVRSCDSSEATHLFLRFAVDFYRKKAEIEQVRQLDSVVYFRPVSDASRCYAEYWILELPQTLEVAELRKQLRHRWTDYRINRRQYSAQAASVANRPRLEGRFQAIKEALDNLRAEESRDDYETKLIDGGDYFSFGGEGFAFSEEAMTEAERLLERMIRGEDITDPFIKKILSH